MKKKISIIGGGTAAIFLANFLDSKEFDITVYDRNKALGRKFLVAGDGGFNLTHAEPIEQFIHRYTPVDFLKQSLLQFNNQDFIAWLECIGIETFKGSSNRIYPQKGIKPIQVLKTLQDRSINNGVNYLFQQNFEGFSNNNNPLLNTIEMISDYTIFCLGGGSWKVTGSDGNWLESFKKSKIQCNSFEPSNCEFHVNWAHDFLINHQGKPLKNIQIQSLDTIQKGEVVITENGIEGNGIYGLSPQIRAQFNEKKEAIVFIDFKPTLSEKTLATRIQESKSKTTVCLKKEIKLSSTAIAMLKSVLSKDEFLSAVDLAKYIKSFPLKISKIGDIDKAISTVGGIDRKELSENFELNKHPNVFCIGEMVDWDAPTGGYLIQACVSMAKNVADFLNEQK